MIKYFKLLHTFNGSKHFVILLKKLLRANRVIRNALVFKNKALQFNNSMTWSLIQIIFMFGFNCCCGWGAGNREKDTLLQMGRRQSQAGLTKSSQFLFLPIHQLCKVFCWNSASRFPSSPVSISGSYRLIKRCYIFIFLVNRFWNTWEGFFFLNQVKIFCFPVLKVYIHRSCNRWCV